jgi:hypothetical protein
MLANDPIEIADANDPIDPIERNDHTEPIDRIDPFDRMDRMVNVPTAPDATRAGDLLSSSPRPHRTSGPSGSERAGGAVVDPGISRARSSRCSSSG